MKGRCTVGKAKKKQAEAAKSSRANGDGGKARRKAKGPPKVHGVKVSRADCRKFLQAFSDTVGAACQRCEGAVTEIEIYEGDPKGMKDVLSVLALARVNALALPAKAVEVLTCLFLWECARLETDGPLFILARDLEAWRRAEPDMSRAFWRPESVVRSMGHALTLIASDWGLKEAEEIEKYSEDLEAGQLKSSHREEADRLSREIARELELRQCRERLTGHGIEEAAGERARPPVPKASSLVDDGSPFYPPAYFGANGILPATLARKRRAGLIRGEKPNPAADRFHYSEPDARRQWPDRFKKP
jgi:hypothetical protein